MPGAQRHKAAVHHDESKPSLGFLTTLSIVLGVPYAVVLSVLCSAGGKLTKIAAIHATCFLLAIASYGGIPSLLRALRRKGMCNQNLHRDGDCDKVPEPGSMWACMLYILYLGVVKLTHTNNHDMMQYREALISIAIMTLLGLIDDITPLSLMAKLAAPSIAAIPLCMAFKGETVVITPSITPFIGRAAFDLGLAYHVAMVLCIVFFANAINIHAGINGLEVGQSIIIAMFLLAHNCIEITNNTVGLIETHKALQQQLFSVQLILPFLAINVALLCYNWYPATLFVGNMYTSMAGAFFAVIATLCNCPGLMMLLFLPQLINFVISIPQIIGIKYCPRFRTPRFNPNTGLLEHSTNYTLLNTLLWVCGPMTERRLCVMCLGFQVVCCAVGLGMHRLISYLGQP